MRVLSKLGLAVSASMLAFATPAFAAYDQTISISGTGGKAIPVGSLSFTTEFGDEIPVVVSEDEDDDESIFVIAFPGDYSQAGTLVYTPQGGGEPVRIAVPAARRGDIIDIDLASGTATARPKPLAEAIPVPWGANRSPGIYIDGSFTFREIPATGYGTTGIGTNEEFILESEDYFEQGAYGGGLFFPLGKGFIALGGLYSEGDSSGAASVAAGGAETGFVGIANSDEFGTGVNLGTNGIDLTGTTDFDESLFYAKYALPIPIGADENSTVIPYVALQYRDFSSTQWVQATTPAFPAMEVFSDWSTELDWERFGINFSAIYDIRAAEGVHFGFGGGITGYFDNTELRARQTIGVFGNTDTIAVDEDDDRFSIGLNGDIYMLFAPKGWGGLGFGPYARFEWDEAQPYFRTQVSGNDILDGNNAGIDYMETTRFQLGIRAGLSF